MEQLLAAAALVIPPDCPLVINDIDAGGTEPAIVALARALTPMAGAPVRFITAAQVRRPGGQRCGTLVLADAVCHAGLSAAQTYMLKTHAAQISWPCSNCRSLRALTTPPPGTTGRWSNTERLRLLESVVVNANDAVLITEAEPIDLPGPRIVYCNAAFEKTTGYSEAEILGKTPRILQSSQTDRVALDRLKRALTRWRPVEVELLNSPQGWNPFWVELSIVPVANEKGWFTHWVSVQRDVTDRKRIEDIAVRARVAEAENTAFEKEIETASAWKRASSTRHSTTT